MQYSPRRTWSLALAASALALAANASAATLSLTDAFYGQNFNSLASTGTGPIASLPPGWTFAESGDPQVVDTRYGTNPPLGTSVLLGDTYSFGAPNDPERAFGTMRDGGASSRIGVFFANNTGRVIVALSISYFGEQWFRGGNGGQPDRLDFGYSTTATDLLAGYTNFDALDFESPMAGALGNTDGNVFRDSISGTIDNLNIAPGDGFWLRWTDFDPIGANDGLGIDDFSLTAQLRQVTPPPPPPPPGDGNDVPTPGTMLLALAGLAAMPLIRRRRITAASA
jgi:hypothetical protein